MAKKTETVDPKADAKRAKREAKNAAKERIRNYMASDDCPEDLKADLLLVVGLGRGSGAPSPMASAKAAVLDMVQERGTVSEDDIWSEFKLGRAEMRKVIVNAIKKAKSPEDRVWIRFNPEDGVYEYVATGADIPEGWTGYRPVDVEDIDL